MESQIPQRERPVYERQATFLAIQAVSMMSVLFIAVGFYSLWLVTTASSWIGQWKNFWLLVLSLLAFVGTYIGFALSDQDSSVRSKSRTAWFVIMAAFGALNLSFLACHSHVWAMGIIFISVVALLFLACFMIIKQMEATSWPPVAVLLGTDINCTLIIVICFAQATPLEAIATLITACFVSYAFYFGVQSSFKRRGLDEKSCECCPVPIAASLCGAIMLEVNGPIQVKLKPRMGQIPNLCCPIHADD